MGGSWKDVDPKFLPDDLSFEPIEYPPYKQPTPLSKIRLNIFKSLVNNLCRSFGFEINGCGCCGGPWIDDTVLGIEVDSDVHFK